MVFLKCDERWTGFTRYAPLMNGVVMVVLSITFLLSAILADQRAEPPKSSVWPRELRVPSTSTSVFYSLTTPTLSLIHTITSIFTHHFSRHPPLSSLFLTGLFLIGWCITIGIWGVCDLQPGKMGSFACEKWPMLEYGFGKDGKGVYGMVTGLQYARWTFGVVSLVGYVVLAGVAALAVYREYWWERKGKGLSMQVSVGSEVRQVERRDRDSGWGGFKRSTVYC